MKMLERAIEIAVKAHKGQADKGGNPYILHPLKVMLSCHGDIQKICGVLHDVVEDTDVTFYDLRKEGFSEGIIEVLDCLTKRKDESYDDYINRILEKDTACLVKLEDLKDNIDLSRIQSPKQEDLERSEKYLKAIDKIHAKLYDYMYN